MKTTTETTEKANKAPKWQGIVVSNKMDKTIVVAVETLKTHPKYLKQYRSTKKYKVHVEENKYAIGDKVVFQECRPVSRDKRHKIVAE
ncbi:MAG: 30S ribosomal protein S17 [Candidatus Moranbacteria bacterium RIFCSPHIGHO2_12_FULL_54_9]|nr:MAG: 30S ribosomal protein S17 [Candidatus Moranbacteria bacterium RIFCSPHIGHO2_01_FULL_54_31]OGI26133.1 MAG: 30S ribosomal protein S17 [Candidatus Moranbacteria bacterium RIFCSPHIGHO2_12_FULL_54_9]